MQEEARGVSSRRRPSRASPDGLLTACRRSPPACPTSHPTLETSSKADILAARGVRLKGTSIQDQTQQRCCKCCPSMTSCHGQAVFPGLIANPYIIAPWFTTSYNQCFTSTSSENRCVTRHKQWLFMREAQGRGD